MCLLSRYQSTWKAAYLLGKYLCEKMGTQSSWLKEMTELHKQEGKPLRVLELGSGTGLGGITMAKLLELEQPTLAGTVCLTDICIRALEVINTNLTLAGNLTSHENVTT